MDRRRRPHRRRLVGDGAGTVGRPPALHRPEGALALWSGWPGTDLSRFDLDDPAAVPDNEYLKSSVPMFGQGQWTLRDFVDRHAIDAEGGFTVGSPTQVADDLQEWVEETDVDRAAGGGAYKTSYEDGTLRHRLFGRGARLPETRRAARYRRVTQRQAHLLERHWRNVRTLASHNPTSYKAQALGAYYV